MTPHAPIIQLQQFSDSSRCTCFMCTPPTPQIIWRQIPGITLLHLYKYFTKFPFKMTPFFKHNRYHI